MKIYGKKILKNGAIAGYVEYPDGKLKWRIVGNIKGGARSSKKSKKSKKRVNKGIRRKNNIIRSVVSNMINKLNVRNKYVKVKNESGRNISRYVLGKRPKRRFKPKPRSSVSAPMSTHKAIFFDDSDINLAHCDQFPYIVCVKVSEGVVPDGSFVNYVGNNAHMSSNFAQEITNFLPTIGSPDNGYHRGSGISIAQIDEYRALIIKENINLIVLDFDRTISVFEGLFQERLYEQFVQKNGPEQFKNYILGGKVRADKLLGFMEEMARSGKKIMILTNQPTIRLVNYFINRTGIKQYIWNATSRPEFNQKFGGDFTKLQIIKMILDRFFK